MGGVSHDIRGLCRCPLSEVGQARRLGVGVENNLVLEKLKALADPSYWQFSAKLVPSVPFEHVLGVRMPALRTFAKGFAGTKDARRFIEETPHRYLEENHLHGLLINDETDFDQAVEKLNAFLPLVDNWATCDLLKPKAFARAVRTACGCDRLDAQAHRWLASPHTYTKRFALSLFMNYLLEQGFRKSQLQSAASLDQGDYYVDMMVAWYFATALYARWDEAIPLLEHRVLPQWTHCKAIQKARESRRITAEQKAYLSTLR